MRERAELVERLLTAREEERRRVALEVHVSDRTQAAVQSVRLGRLEASPA